MRDKAAADRERYEGTPLRRFGHYRVTQTKRTPYAAWAVYDTRTGDRVAWSFCKASADFAAERVSTGRPLETPTEALERSLRLFGSIYPSRFRLWDHRYLTIGNGLEWINGGLTSDDVTMLTPEGERARIEEKERHRLEDEAHEALYASLAGADDKLGLSLRAMLAPRPDNFALYRAGAWPEVGEHTALYPASGDYSRLAMLARMDTAAIDPEWMEDARAATRLLLAHGTDGDRVGTVARVRGWAQQLAAKHGGQWEP